MKFFTKKILANLFLVKKDFKLIKMIIQVQDTIFKE